MKQIVCVCICFYVDAFVCVFLFSSFTHSFIHKYVCMEMRMGICESINVFIFSSDFLYRKG